MNWRRVLGRLIGAVLNRNSFVGGCGGGGGAERSGASTSGMNRGRAYGIVNHPFHRHKDPQRNSHTFQQPVGEALSCERGKKKILVRGVCAGFVQDSDVKSERDHHAKAC